MGPTRVSHPAPPTTPRLHRMKKPVQITCGRKRGEGKGREASFGVLLCCLRKAPLTAVEVVVVLTLESKTTVLPRSEIVYRRPNPTRHTMATLGTHDTLDTTPSRCTAINPLVIVTRQTADKKSFDEDKNPNNTYIAPKTDAGCLLGAQHKPRPRNESAKGGCETYEVSQNFEVRRF